MQTTNEAKIIPKAKAKDPLIKNTRVMLSNTLDFFTSMRKQYGDIYNANVIGSNLVIVSRPSMIQKILVSEISKFPKSKNYETFKLSVGNGLVTNEGESWKRQRKIAQPAFYKESIANLFDILCKVSQDHLQNWKGQQKINAVENMLATTLDMVVQSLFGESIDMDYDRLSKAFITENQFLSDQVMNPFSLPIWIPTASARRYKKARSTTSELVETIINKRKEKDATPKNDLLGMLMSSRYSDTGEGMSNQQLKDEVVSILFAGHEATANSMSWALYLLAKYPEHLKKVKEEVQRVTQGQPLKLEHLSQMVYTQQVIDESMRLYPSAWALSRTVHQDTDLEGYTIKKNSLIFLDFYNMYRDEAIWEHPNDFIPERFQPELKKQMHKCSFVPFGAGQRMCIGYQFAFMEMKILLADIVSNYDFVLDPDAPEVEVEPLTTLKPKDGVWISVTPLDKA
ncbi:cytochrome P450 [Aureispira anguillae]|uniref:Cytochrome P450 n=1 Tax=Aureispira anguillae TaxID=2864201 RepID=A0A915VKK3_9BACT|nr:cytochrome P450 [Aureispira anguillae]BDS09709.1 cytochrome P450 [Aureispira anguillae]